VLHTNSLVAGIGGKNDSLSLSLTAVRLSALIGLAGERYLVWLMEQAGSQAAQFQNGVRAGPNLRVTSAPAIRRLEPANPEPKE